VRREGGLYAYERALARAGLTPVAGADEAGRGACAALVVAAVVLPAGPAGQVPELADSKLLTAAARERVRPGREEGRQLVGGDRPRG
jgi:ribonuclease HII